MQVKNAIVQGRAATPENYDAINKLVLDVVAREIPKCGQQGPALKEEAEQVMKQALQRVELVKAHRLKEEERRVEEARKQKEAEENTKKALADLAGLVDAAEAATTKLKDAAAPMEGVATSLAKDEIEKVFQATEEAGPQAQTACKACTTFIVDNRPVMESFTQGLAETRAELVKLQTRIHECLKTTNVTIEATKSSRDHAMKRLSAIGKTQKQKDTFEKYDEDKDGKLNKKEVLAYAEGEFKFTVPPDALERILRVCSTDALGVDFKSFMRLRCLVGASREEARSAMRKAEAERRRQRLGEMKAELDGEVEKSVAQMDAADRGVVAAEAKVQSLAQAGGAGHDEFRGLVEEAAEAAKAAQEALATAKEALAQLNKMESTLDDELKPHLTVEVRKLGVRAEHYASRLDQSGNGVRQGRAAVAKRERAEMEVLRTEAAKVMRTHFAEKAPADGPPPTTETIFASVDKDGDGAISLADFKAFFAEVSGDKPSEDNLARLFAYLDEGDSKKIPKDVFLRLVRVYYKVVRETVLSDSINIKESKVVRRVEPDEVIEIDEGPVKEDSVGVMRIKGRATRDGTVGWATISGNQGSVFLVPGGNTMDVVREASLTTAFESDSEEVRKLRAGESLEVWEWFKEEEKTRKVRLKGRVQGDGAVGWVTASDNEGGVFLKVS